MCTRLNTPRPFHIKCVSQYEGLLWSISSIRGKGVDYGGCKERLSCFRLRQNLSVPGTLHILEMMGCCLGQLLLLFESREGGKIISKT